MLAYFVNAYYGPNVWKKGDFLPYDV